MGVTGIGAPLSAANTEKINPKLGSTNLDIQDFFKLLTAQLKNQSMFEPASDTEFIAQMAQFSTLQMMQELGNMFQNTYAVALIGKTIKVQTNMYGQVGVETGKVEKVLMQQGVAQLIVNGRPYQVGEVLEVLEG